MIQCKTMRNLRIAKMYLLAMTLIFFSSEILGLENSNVCSNIWDYNIINFSCRCYYNPDVLSNADSIVTGRGYNINNHSVTTPDGYILTLFQIVPKASNSKPPVFIQHGFSSNCLPFVAVSNRSLAFFLVDHGYEVWLGNYRGSTYSRKHIKYEASDEKFWNFSLDEIAQFDIKAQLEMVADKTGKAGSIIYIGHNAGTTLGFMFASLFPKEMERFVQGIIAIAPIVYLKGSFHLGFSNPLIIMANYLGIKGAVYQEEIIHESAVNFCKFAATGCENFYYFFFGRSKQFAPEDIPLFFSYWPSGTSVKFAYHFHQIYQSDEFKKYDYGEQENLAIYGTKKPPAYNLSKVTRPTYFYYGTNDAFFTQKNLERLINELGSTKKQSQKVPKNNDTYAFNHYDFMFGRYVKELFYEDLLQTLEREFI